MVRLELIDWLFIREYIKKSVRLTGATRGRKKRPQ